MAVAMLGEVERIAAAQWGLVTSAQAVRAGVSRVQLSRLAASGRLERMLSGVYRSRAVPPDRADGVRAAWLTADPSQLAEDRIGERAAGVVVGGATAAYLHGIGDLQPEPVELYAPVRHQTERAGIRYRIRALEAADVTLVDGLPVTGLERTLADLVRDRHDLSLVGDALRDAVQRHALDLGRLEQLLDPLAGPLQQSDGAALLQWLADTAQVQLRPAETEPRLKGLDVQQRWLQQILDTAAGRMDPLRKTVLAQVIDAGAAQQALVDQIRASGVLAMIEALPAPAGLPPADVIHQMQERLRQQAAPLQHLAARTSLNAAVLAAPHAAAASLPDRVASPAVGLS